MIFKIIGTMGRGEETPAFDARLEYGGRRVAELRSAGEGGCARVSWDLDRGTPDRLAAEAWLASEARRIWIETVDLDPPALLNAPTEAAILVVPAHLGARSWRS